VLTGLIATERVRHPVARPFLGVGVLVGFTTFSTFALDTHALADAGHLPGALAYVGLTVAASLAAALVGVRSVGQR
jgi:CrcB protein